MSIDLEQIRRNAKKIYTPESGYRELVSDVRALYDKLLEDFTAAYEDLDAESPLYKIAHQIEDEVKKLADVQNAHGKAYRRDVYYQLCDVLYRCQLAISDKNTYPNMDALAKLAKEVPGFAGSYLKGLALLLFVVAAMAMMIGFLMVLPTGGTSLLLSYVAAMGLGTIISTMSALVTTTATAGAAAIGHGVTATAFAGTVGIGGGAISGLIANGLFWDAGLSKSVAKFHKQVMTEVGRAAKAEQGAATL